MKITHRTTSKDILDIFQSLNSDKFVIVDKNNSGLLKSLRTIEKKTNNYEPDYCNVFYDRSKKKGAVTIKNKCKISKNKITFFF